MYIWCHSIRRQPVWESTHWYVYTNMRNESTWDGQFSDRHKIFIHVYYFHEYDNRNRLLTASMNSHVRARGASTFAMLFCRLFFMLSLVIFHFFFLPSIYDSHLLNWDLMWASQIYTHIYNICSVSIQPTAWLCIYNECWRYFNYFH